MTEAPLASWKGVEPVFTTSNVEEEVDPSELPATKTAPAQIVTIQDPDAAKPPLKFKILKTDTRFVVRPPMKSFIA